MRLMPRRPGRANANGAQVNQETIAGAWIVEGAIATLVIVLLAKALGCSASGWLLVIVSFVIGYLLIALFHFWRRSNRGSDPAE